MIRNMWIIKNLVTNNLSLYAQTIEALSLSLFLLCVSYHMINLLDIPSLCTAVKRNEYLFKNIFYLMNHLYMICIYCLKIF